MVQSLDLSAFVLVTPEILSKETFETVWRYEKFGLVAASVLKYFCGAVVVSSGIFSAHFQQSKIISSFGVAIFLVFLCFFYLIHLFTSTTALMITRMIQYRAIFPRLIFWIGVPANRRLLLQLGMASFFAARLLAILRAAAGN